MLDLCESLATRYFAPHNKKGDANEPSFDGETVTIIPEVKEALDAFARADLISMGMDAELGGAQLPMAVAGAGLAWFHAANTSTAAYVLLTQANANLLAYYGTAEQIDAFLKPMLAGRFSGTMCLSEPQAGSSLADIVTVPNRATTAPTDCSDRRCGSPVANMNSPTTSCIWCWRRFPAVRRARKASRCSSCRSTSSPPTAPSAQRNDVVLAGLNHKMGYRGTTNTVLNFGEGGFRPGGEPGAVGYLVGEPHRGLSYMFHMMNEARLGVGLGAIALGYTGYLKSLDYARNRPQGRPVTAKDPTAAQVPIIEHPDVKRMLLAQKSYVEGALALALYCGRLIDISPQPRKRRGARVVDAAAGHLDADRQELAVTVVPGGQQSGHPGARRLRLHPRV